ncbi:M20/M25/M40 family metallo-hydrolase [Myxococcota bacterium]|nr:M20/M25/M40 family metallo-hydrolase [Myxococcota bacterium]
MRFPNPITDVPPPIRSRPTGSLIGFLLALALVPVESQAIWPFDTDDTGQVEASSSVEYPEVATFLSEAIQIDTVDPPGNEEALARMIAGHLADAGIQTNVIDTPGAGRAAVWARVPGTGKARPIILLSHIDVVPADPAEWEHDPFGGKMTAGFVHGRGALDAKGLTAVHVFTLLALSELETPLDRDVILIATPGEETGGVQGAGFIARQRPELLGEAEFLLTEGGGIRPRRSPASANPMPPMWGITVTEKSPCWLEIQTRGTPGHGSSPRPDAAVPRLIAALDRVRRVESPVRVLPEVQQMFLALATSAPPEDRAGFLSLRSALSTDSDFSRRFLSRPGYNALVRNTLSITVLEGSRSTNVVPGVARARLDARLLPGERCEDFVRGLEGVIADPSVSVETLLAFPSQSSPSSTELFQAIQRVAMAQDPDAIVVPRMIGGFTDAHWFREQGIVSYGFVPRWLDEGDARGVHGANERISIENLTRGVETSVAILKQLGQSSEPREATSPNP